MHITNDIRYVGVNDHKVDLFEGFYPVPNGMAYNSYLIIDEKIAVMDSVEHGFANGEIIPDGINLRIQWIQIKVILFTTDGSNSGSNSDAHFLQPLLAQATGDAQRSCQPPGEMTATGSILKAAVLHLGGIVGMAGTGTILQIVVISGTGVFISDDGGNGCTAGKAIHHSA